MAPQSGGLFCLIVDGVDADVFQFFLDETAKAIPKKKGMRQLLILDNASWHKAAWFWDFFARTHEALTDRLCTALKSFMDQPAKTASICSIRK